MLTHPKNIRGEGSTAEYKRPERVSLGLEGEAGANLVGSLVQVLGIKGSTEAKSDTRAEEDVVGQSGNTAVVDLGLYWRKRSD